MEKIRLACGYEKELSDEKVEEIAKKAMEFLKKKKLPLTPIYYCSAFLSFLRVLDTNGEPDIKEIEENFRKFLTARVSSQAREVRLKSEEALSKAIPSLTDIFGNSPLAILLIKPNVQGLVEKSDEIFSMLGDFIRGLLRSGDIFVRADELFAVLIPDVTFGQAIRIADRIRRAVKESEFSLDGKIFRATVAIGVSTGNSKSSQAVLNDAKRALSLAVKGGFDSVKTSLDVELEE